MPKLYTVKVLAEMFDKDEETIRRWIRDGDVFPHAFKVKDGFYVPASDVNKLMRANGSDSAREESPQTRQQRQSGGFVTGWKRL